MEVRIMTVRTVARMIGIAAVVWCAGLFPEEAAAQCAYSYHSTWVNDEYGNRTVTTLSPARPLLVII
jgi:hypothetical protein